MCNIPKMHPSPAESSSNAKRGQTFANRVHVSSLPHDTDQYELRGLFQSMGYPVRGVKIIGRSDGTKYAFVSLCRAEDAEAIVKRAKANRGIVLRKNTSVCVNPAYKRDCPTVQPGHRGVPRKNSKGSARSAHKLSPAAQQQQQPQPQPQQAVSGQLLPVDVLLTYTPVCSCPECCTGAVLPPTLGMYLVQDAVPITMPAMYAYQSPAAAATSFFNAGPIQMGWVM